MNTTLTRWIAVALLVASSTPVFAQEQEEDETRPAPATRPRVWAPLLPIATLLARPHIDADIIEPLYNDAITRTGTIDQLVATLTRASQDATKPAHARANALLVSSHVLWRHGRIAPALQAVDAGLALQAGVDLVYYKARLLDASGDVTQAQEWYQKALALTIDPQVKAEIRLRLTFIDATDRHADSLVDLAKTRDHAFRNRAAVALAILGHPDDALHLYQVDGQGSERFREHLRLAQWALVARNAATAKEEAWTAVQTATLDRDRRYALSLLTEAHAADGSLDQLLARFASQTSLTLDEQRVRIELLRQTGRYQQAIDLFTSANRGDLGPELQQELLRMYSDAGQDKAMIAEYTALIAREPASTTWPQGLSQYYLEQGDRPGATRVWEAFVSRNTTLDVLIEGAEAMTSFGLHDLAIAATEKAAASNPGVESEGKVRLAQFELYRGRGMTTEAEATLVALEKRLPADSAYRGEIADAYERIKKPQLALQVLEGLARTRGGLSVDEQMRLAWLLDSTGRRDDALAQWKALWSRETQSARRRLVEDRLLLLAAELGQLGDLAVELEGKLANGTANPKDSSLLIAIYTKVGDSVSAVEVINEYFAKAGKTREAEIASLREQAQVYLALDEYVDFARVTRRLLEIDPEGRVDHLQALIMNQIESGVAAKKGDEKKGDDSAQIRDWLRQLHEVGGEAVTGEFEAGVLDLAGFRGEAIEAYRRALALHPERSDNYLLLADLLKQMGRQEEAIASLQYVTEIAQGDDLFLVAIDGIGNMRTRNAATMKWAERRALERLTGRDDKLYLYEMLADLAEESRDMATYTAALENSLAHANNRRPHVLRELLASTAESSLFASGQGLHRPDPARNLMYARRLIALGEELPPDVYTGLGKTFLKMREPDSAQRAFNMAVDRTGRTSVVLEAATLFDQGGYEREAISQYEKVLIADSGNVPAMYKLGRLRDRVGLSTNANELYLHALLDLASRQALSVEKGAETTPPALETLVTFDLRRYWAYLVNGFLSTMPADAGARQQAIAPIEATFTGELQAVAATTSRGPLMELAYYPRLTLLAQLLRAAARGAGARDVADRHDAALLRQFAHDTGLRARIVAERREAGYVASAVALAGASSQASSPGASASSASGTSAPSAGVASSNAGLPRMQTRDDFQAEINRALLTNDQAAALAAYRQWARVAGLPKPPLRIRGMAVPDRSAGIPEVTTDAFTHLDAPHFASLAQYVQGLINEQDVYAERLLFGASLSSALGETDESEPLRRIETALGAPLLDEPRIMRVINNAQQWRTLDLPYAIARLSPDNQIDVLGRYARRDDVDWLRLFTGIGVALSKPLDAAHGEALLAALTTPFQTGLKKPFGAFALSNLMNSPFTRSVHASNVPLVQAMERFLAEKYPQAFGPSYFTANLMRDLGRDREALPAFVEAALRMYTVDSDETPTGVQTRNERSYKLFVQRFASFIYPARKAEIARLLDEKEQGGAGPTDALIGLRLELLNNDPSIDYAQMLTSLKAMLARYPDNERLLKAVYPLFERWGRTGEAIEALTRLTQLQPDNDALRYRLLTLWQKQDHPEHAVDVMGGRTLDDLSRSVPRNLFAEFMAGGPLGQFPVLKRYAERAVGTNGLPANGPPANDAAANGGPANSEGDAKQRALAFRSLLQALPPSGLPTTEFRMHMMDTGDPYLLLGDLFGLDAPGARSGSDGARATTATATSKTPATPPMTMTQRLVQSIDGTPRAGLAGESSSSRAGTLLDAVIAQPFAVDELETYMRTLRAEELDAQYAIYELYVDACVRHGRAAGMLSALTPVVQSGNAGRKDTALWLAFAARQSDADARPLLDIAERGLTASELTAYQRVLLARLTAKAGRSARAAEIYQAVAASALAEDPAAANNYYEADPYGKDNGFTLFTAMGLYDEAQAHLDRDGVARVVGSLLSLVPPRPQPDYQQLHARFLMRLQHRLLDANQSIPIVDQAVNAIRLTDASPRQDVLLAVLLRARVGKIDEAMTMLRSALKKDFDVTVAWQDPFANYYGKRGTGAYATLLGLGGGRGSSGVEPKAAARAVEEVAALFPTRADAWPRGQAQAWIARVAGELPRWVEQQAVNRDAAVQTLAVVVRRLHQIGDASGARAAVASLSALLRGATVSSRAATLAVAVTDTVGIPIDLTIAQELVRANLLDIGTATDVVKRTAREEGAEPALTLGDAAATLTSNQDLLNELVRIARTAGNEAQAQRWIARRQQAASARAKLGQVGEANQSL
jgi:predicted Zn-dependent protease